METYEIQVLQSHDNPTYPSGYAGSFYLASPEGGAVPLVLPINPPGEWNTYDIVWRGPRFDDGELRRYPQLTVFFNGVAIINHFDVPGPNYWVDLFEDDFDNDTNPHPQNEDGTFLEEAPSCCRTTVLIRMRCTTGISGTVICLNHLSKSTVQVPCRTTTANGESGKSARTGQTATLRQIPITQTTPSRSSPARSPAMYQVTPTY